MSPRTRERPVAQFLPHVHQRFAMEALAVEKLEDKEGREQIDDGRKREVTEKLNERVFHPAMNGDEQILRIPDRTHDAAQRHGKREREQQHLGRHAVLFGQQQHQRRADDRERVVHQERRGAPRAEKNQQDQAIGRRGTVEYPVGKMKQVTALLQRLPHDKHPEKKQHDVGVNRAQRRRRVNLAGRQNHHRPEQHDLPQLEVKPADPPHRNEQEYGGKNDNGNVHGPGQRSLDRTGGPAAPIILEPLPQATGSRPNRGLVIGGDRTAETLLDKPGGGC